MFEKLFGRRSASAAATEPNGPRWNFAGSCVDGEIFRLHGLNVWDYPWQDVDGEAAHVKDPIYYQDFVFGVYAITSEGRTVTFAAGEFSNLIWGFYLPVVMG